MKKKIIVFNDEENVYALIGTEAPSIEIEEHLKNYKEKVEDYDINGFLKDLAKHIKFTKYIIPENADISIYF